MQEDILYRGEMAKLNIQPPPGKRIRLERLTILLEVIRDEDIPQVEQELQAVIDAWIAAGAQSSV